MEGETLYSLRCKDHLDRPPARWRIDDADRAADDAAAFAGGVLNGFAIDGRPDARPGACGPSRPVANGRRAD
jgi:hypothetical protein